jgi:purine-binding chemotaxis protein CheW
MPLPLCAFTLDELWFAVDVARVQEVLRYQKPARAPLAPPAVAGLINLRGRIVPLLDLRLRLDMLPRPAKDEPAILIVSGPEGPVGLLADEVGDVIEVNEETYSPTPDMVKGPARDLIRGAYWLDGRLLHVLDADRTLSLESRVP